MTESKTPKSDKLESMSLEDAWRKEAIALARKLEIENAELRAEVSAAHLALDGRISDEREKNAVILDKLERIYGGMPAPEVNKNIEINLVPETTIQSFADAHNLIMEVIERSPNRPPHTKRFYARFKGAGISMPGGIEATSGNGDSVDEAIADYADCVSYKVLVLDPRTSTEKRISVPKLKYRGGGW